MPRLVREAILRYDNGWRRFPVRPLLLLDARAARDELGLDRRKRG